MIKIMIKSMNSKAVIPAFAPLAMIWVLEGDEHS